MCSRTFFQIKAVNWFTTNITQWPLRQQCLIKPSKSLRTKEINQEFSRENGPVFGTTRSAKNKDPSGTDHCNKWLDEKEGENIGVQVVEIFCENAPDLDTQDG